MATLEIKTVEAQTWENPSDLKASYEYMGKGIGLVCIGYKLSQFASENDKVKFQTLLEIQRNEKK